MLQTQTGCSRYTMLIGHALTFKLCYHVDDTGIHIHYTLARHLSSHHKNPVSEIVSCQEKDTSDLEIVCVEVTHSTWQFPLPPPPPLEIVIVMEISVKLNDCARTPAGCSSDKKYFSAGASILNCITSSTVIVFELKLAV